MKIHSAKVRSFGELKEREFVFDEKLNVIYGKNETGKTSLMEFIRGTLFPDNKKSHYPEYKPSDHGELALSTDKGDTILMIREGKKVSSDVVPSEMTNIDYDSYQKIFAMSPEGLRDSKIISSGDIKNRFLTIPGGEAIPGIKTDLDDSMKSLMSSERRSSTTEIAKLQKSIEENNKAIRDAKEVDSSYSTLKKEKEELCAQLEALRATNMVVESSAKVFERQESQKGNVVKLEELKKEKERLSPSSIITAEDHTKYAQLNEKLSNAISVRDSEIQDIDDRILRGLNLDAILSNRSTIEKLKENKGEYNAAVLNISNFETNADNERKKMVAPSASTYMTKKSVNKISLIAGIAIFALSAVVGLMFNYLIMAVGVIALVICAVLAFRGTNAASVASKPVDNSNVKYWEDQIRTEKGKIYRMNRELDAVSARVGMDKVSFNADVDLLFGALAIALKKQDCDSKTALLNRDVLDAEAELNIFLSRFGGRDRFLELCEMKKQYDGVCNSISTLNESMVTSGYDPSTVIEERPDTQSIQDEIRDISRQIGVKEADMNAICKDDIIESLLDKKMKLQTDLFDLVKKWAVLSLASKMVDDACNVAYSDIQPGVIKSADGLLKTMTCGRYGLEMDLRDNNIKAISGSVGKVEGQWSTGLGDQIYLSIKLAVAKEMCKGETLPILLDDVLQMFDSDRKRNACRALSELSEELQIILFTCDAETLMFMRENNGCTVVELPGIV